MLHFILVFPDVSMGKLLVLHYYTFSGIVCFSLFNCFIIFQKVQVIAFIMPVIQKLPKLQPIQKMEHRPLFNVSPSYVYVAHLSLISSLLA